MYAEAKVTVILDICPEAISALASGSAKLTFSAFSPPPALEPVLLVGQNSSCVVARPWPQATRTRKAGCQTQLECRRYHYGMELDAGILALMIPLSAIAGGVTIAILVLWAKHRERISMIDQGLDPDARAKQHEERMAMIKQGMHPDGPELEEDDPERDPRLIER